MGKPAGREDLKATLLHSKTCILFLATNPKEILTGKDLSMDVYSTVICGNWGLGSYLEVHHYANEYKTGLMHDHLYSFESTYYTWMGLKNTVMSEGS